MKRLLTIALSLLAITTFAQKDQYLLAGTYTGGKSKGIYVYQFNGRSGATTLVDSVASPNPSYLAVSPDQKFVYAVSEVKDGKVRAFSLDKKSGHLTLLNEQSSMGENPCYITVDKTGKWVIVGNYSSGSLAVLPVQKDGSLGASVSTIAHKGSGPNARRQEGPHVHATVLSRDNRYLFVPDLGIDKLMIYSFDEKTGKLGATKDSAVSLPAGSGPRHFEFHPTYKWAYLIQELSGTVTVFHYADGTGDLTPVQTITTLPDHFNQYFTSADIHASPDGRLLYASNRDSANTMAIYQVDFRTGQLKSAGFQSTIGRTPRNFSFDPYGNFVLVANQNSDEIVVFEVSRQSGALLDTGKRISIGNPVCIKWAARK